MVSMTTTYIGNSHKEVQSEKSYIYFVLNETSDK